MLSILTGKYTSQNQLVIALRMFTNLIKTQPCKYFAYLGQGNPS